MEGVKDAAAAKLARQQASLVGELKAGVGELHAASQVSVVVETVVVVCL